MTLREGDQLATYEVVRRIAAGGTAEVWEVRHTILGSRHALKVLQPHLVEREDVRQRFLREGKLQSSLDHPGIVRVTDVIAEPGVAGLVMDLLDGEALDEHVDRAGPVAVDQARAWLLEVLDAIGHAHERGIIHRDLKPANLFLVHDGRIRVLDFGIAKVLDQRQTATQATLGTAAFMSPEQVAHPASVDHRTDLFSLGAVFYELVTGTAPFEGATVFDTMQRVVAGTYRPASAVPPGLPPWVDAVIARALATSPNDRFQSAAEFAAALTAPQAVRAPTAPLQLAQPPPPRRSVLPLLLGGVAVSAAAMAFGMWWLVWRPVLHDITVVSTACGTWELSVDARAGERDLLARVDGEEVGRQTVDRRDDYVFTGVAAPGTSVQFEIAFEDGPSLSRTVTTDAFDGTLVLRDAGPWPEGRVPAVEVDIDSDCPLPRGSRWKATIDGTQEEGGVQALGFVLPTSGIREGRWPVAVEVYRGDDPLLSSEIRLEVTAPCVDADLDGHTTCDNDCDDSDPHVHPGMRERPGDRVDNDCDGVDGKDADGDGYLSVGTGGSDCDDDDRRVNPGAPELATPNGVDDDCGGLVDEGTTAFDDDGDRYSEDDGDCNDADPDVHPAATELPDCRDQDCDGDIDEGVALPSVDDGYEPNDTYAAATDLAARGSSFSRDLGIVTRDDGDDEWFHFYSQDGLLDTWGIDVTAVRLPEQAAYRLEVIGPAGAVRASKTVTRDGQMAAVRGQGFRNDSGVYKLHIVPVKAPRPWCPATFRVVSR
jgi:tRNA A-37 threonylcarbamoyl transferase component Bud32